MIREQHTATLCELVRSRTNIALGPHFEEHGDLEILSSNAIQETRVLHSLLTCHTCHHPGPMIHVHALTLVLLPRTNQDETPGLLTKISLTHVLIIP